MASGATKLWRSIFGGADEATPGIRASRYSDLSRTQRSELSEIALEEARETYSGSRRGIFRRPTADTSDLKSAARQRLLDEAADRGITLSPSDLTRMTAKAASVAEKGGTVYRGVATAGSILGKSALIAPIAVPLAGAGALYYGATSLMENFNPLSMFSGTNEATLSGGVSGIFNKVSDGLEYLGMAPWAADIITAFGAFGAIRGAMFAVEAATGLNKIPSVGLLTTIAAIAITANIAFNGDEEPSATVQNDRAMASTGITAPAPAMP